MMVANEKRNPYLYDYGQRQKVQYQREGYTRTQPQRQVRQRAQSQRTNRNIKRAQKRRKLLIRRTVFLIVSFLFLYLVILFFSKLLVAGMEMLDKENGKENLVNEEVANAKSLVPEELVQGISLSDYAKHPTWLEDFLTPNEYSRPGDALEEINSVFVHYTANPGTSAAQNRSYFEQQKDTHERSVSAHFIIGYEGEIIQCVPLDEIAYAVQTRNLDSVSIECCYLKEDGSFTQETYDSLIKLLQ